ncbi:MAG: AAA family ATPase [Nanoarchaeota archaeon]|nr:AAA family ATPase [Nanoarchaeota archaeon]
MAKNEAMEALQRENLLLKSEVERLSSPPFRAGTVLDTGKKTVRVFVDGSGTYEIGHNESLNGKVKRGCRVTLNKDLAIVDSSEFSDLGSQVATVDEVEPNRIRVELKGEHKYVLSISPDVRAGDEVVLDSSGLLAIEKLSRKKTKYNLERVPQIPWDRIGGLEETIKSIRSEIEHPFVHREVYARYGSSPIKGALLFGPPGCGKTLVAKAIAYNLAKTTGHEDGHFISIKGPEILNMWLGNSEANVRRIYQSAREVANGALVVIFIDEAESIFRVRGSSVSTDAYDSIVPQLLTEMDGLEENHNIITLLATNREDSIDPAVLRPGRIDRKIKIPRPSREGAYEIFGIYLKDKPVQGLFKGSKRESLTHEAVERIYSPEPVCTVVNPHGEALGSFTYRNMISGAMIKGIVDRACRYAIERETVGGTIGIGKEDISRALDTELRENLELDQFFVESDWNDVFGDKGKQMYEAHKRGYLQFRKGPGQIQTAERGQQ